MTAEMLLGTKLYAPPLRRDLVARPGLLAKLDHALSPEMRLVVISAPAGFGKTTLVCEWLSALTASGLRVKTAWLTLDEGDNDPIHFWRYVNAALQIIDPRLGESIQPALLASQPVQPRTIVTGLINDLLAVNEPLILVLDDYHSIENEAIQESMNFLIDHLPPLTLLVIATRSDPPLQLAHRRGHGELLELRATDLRFTLEESTHLMNSVMRLSLAHEDIAALTARTEGWIVGLQMAAISLQDVTDPHAFVSAFHGDDRYIADYLFEEVLQRQPVEFQQFLLYTSILDRLSGPLCDALTGRSDSQTVLNALERANLFLNPLDNRREWFRYHQLFASLMRQRLSETYGSQLVSDLKRRAGQWYAVNGYLFDAVEMALDCKDFEQAAEWVELSEGQLFSGGELNTLLKWAQILPADIIASRPHLNVNAAWAAHATGHPQITERFIQMIERTAGVTLEDFLASPSLYQHIPPAQRYVLIEAAVISSSMAVNRLDLERTFALGERLLPLLDPGTRDLATGFPLPKQQLAPLLFVLGRAHTFLGGLTTAMQFMERASDEARRFKNPHILGGAMGHIGEIQMLQGQMDMAQATFEQTLQLAASYPPHSSAFWGLASIGLGSLAYERNDLKAAVTHLHTGLEQGKLLSIWEILLPGCVCLAQVHQARGEWEQAQASLNELLELNALKTHPAVEAWRALLALRRGDLHAATQWTATFDAHTPGKDCLQWEEAALIAARIELSEGKYTETEHLLAGLLSEAQSAGRIRRVVEIRMLQALLFQAQKQPDQAREALSSALEMAEPRGYVRLFVDEGQPMEALIAEIGAQSGDTRLSQYTGTLLAAFSSPRKGPSPSRAPLEASQTLIEPLSERELEVLALMAQGLSNPDIARKLYVSPNTLKAHAQNIYTKLDAHNRMEAVNKARALGLLKSP